jgi:hypothetical protein
MNCNYNNFTDLHNSLQHAHDFSVCCLHHSLLGNNSQLCRFLSFRGHILTGRWLMFQLPPLADNDWRLPADSFTVSTDNHSLSHASTHFRLRTCLSAHQFWFLVGNGPSSSSVVAFMPVIAVMWFGCLGNVFTEPLLSSGWLFRLLYPSNGCFFLLHNSGFEPSCLNMKSFYKPEFYHCCYTILGYHNNCWVLTCCINVGYVVGPRMYEQSFWFCCVSNDNILI